MPKPGYVGYKFQSPNSGFGNLLSVNSFARLVTNCMHNIVTLRYTGILCPMEREEKGLSYKT
jgi:hypothetical protein